MKELWGGMHQRWRKDQMEKSKQELNISRRTCIPRKQDKHSYIWLITDRCSIAMCVRSYDVQKNHVIKCEDWKPPRVSIWDYLLISVSPQVEFWWLQKWQTTVPKMFFREGQCLLLPHLNYGTDSHTLIVTQVDKDNQLHQEGRTVKWRSMGWRE